MVFWRGEAWTAFFDHLDRHGSFYYEVTSLIVTPHDPIEITYEQRWGDAPVHTITLLAGTDRIHFYCEIGYEDDGYTHSPLDDLWRCGRRTYDPAQNFGMRSDSSMVESPISFVRFCGIVVSSEVGTDKLLMLMMAGLLNATHLEDSASRWCSPLSQIFPFVSSPLVYWLRKTHLLSA